MKTAGKSLCALALLLLCACQYEFPESPYPDLQTLPTTAISSNGFTLQLMLNKLAAEPITEVGFLWGEQGTITLNGEEVIIGPASQTGIYSTNVTFQMEDNTDYAVRGFVRTATYTLYDNGTVVFSR